jgi:NTE family protein
MTPEEISGWVPFLKRIPLFSGLSAEDVARVTQRMQSLSLPKNSNLYSQGDEPDALYIVTSGQVRIVHKRGSEETVVAFLGRGEVLGEGGLLTGEPRSMTVKLNTTCEFLKLLRKDFEDILRETPSILLHLSRMLSQRLVPKAGPTRRLSQSHAQIITLNAGLSRPDRLLLTLHLGLQLLEQSRRRVLVVDMGADAGSVARALGLKPDLVTEQAVRELNLRDPGMIRSLAQQHVSGLAVMSLQPGTLGGRLYSGIYLFLNFLRELHDLVLVSLSGELGDVERTILGEADQAIVAGSAAHRPQFRQLESELLSLIEPKKVVRVWLGEAEFEDPDLAPAGGSLLIPWPDAITEEFDLSGSAFTPFDSHPKAMKGIERLCRKLAGLKVGLALGTGAALGLACIGVLKVFKKEGIPIDVIAGTSIGSLIGGLLALGLEPEEIEELALRIDKAWVYENLFWDITVPRSGLFAGQTLLRFIRSYFGSREFSELELPYACVATDIETGEEVVMREGRVAEAIRASCGLPMIFSPIRIGGRYLVDGGLVNPVPVSVLADMGADILLAVNLTVPAGDRESRMRNKRIQDKTTILNAPLDLQSLKELTLPEALKTPNMFDVFFQMIYTMEYEIAQTRFEMADMVIHPDLKGFSWTEMHRGREIIRAGQRVAEQYVPQIKALIPFFSDYCKVPLRLASPWKPEP